MEENNFNQNVGSNAPGQPYVPYQGQPGNPGQFQPQTQSNNVQATNNASKKGVPLIIFGIILLISAVLIVTLIIENKNSSNNSDSLINEDTKTLIVYFSKDGENYGKNLSKENVVTLSEGNTKIMAEKIKSFINSDLYEMIPTVPYPDDLQELYDQTLVEKNRNTLPKIKNEVSNLDSYDVIFIGYPIWHAAYPQIIKTFISDNKEILEKKIIVPFNTHAGSGSAGTYKKLFDEIGTPVEKGLNGLAINGTEVNTSDETIKNWLKGLGYNIK